MFDFLSPRPPRARIAARALRHAAGMLLIGLTALSGTMAAAASAYPAKPITLVVPFPPGGPTDSSARLFSKAMSEKLGQPVIVENRAGAGGSVGTAAVTRAQADGYTLLWGGTSSLVVAPALYTNLQYDPIKSFTPIGMAVRGPLILVGRPDYPPHTLSDLVGYAKNHRVTIASAGTGSIGHLAAELFNNTAGIHLLHVPYRGGAPAMTDVIGGQVDLLFDTVTLLYPQIAAGKLRAYATTGVQRYAKLPDVPTLSEALGQPYEAYSWFGLLAPAGTPPAVVDTLARALTAAAKDPDVIRQMQDLGLEPVGGTPQDYARTIQTDLAKWTGIVKTANVKPE
ncbi:Bug family tripartite tricarboxylate transporter substrate binding protein [Bordetella genomosp. 9]|uniref:Bug family tripartite tricarboxylate transporter substrate binding protein n=1 Tax=Bordetella genomosp. 9 TaxID=1416803 RepID=UPI001E5FA77B|nr:tripartite tricarboxylate transporter substrate binding protein [Bordetella genomosp. 9]